MNNRDIVLLKMMIDDINKISRKLKKFDIKSFEDFCKCVTFSLITEVFQENILDKRFDIGRKIYNAVLSKVYKRYNCLIETKAYRNLKLLIKESDGKQRKLLFKQLNEMYKCYSLNEYSLHEDVKEMQHQYQVIQMLNFLN